MGLSIKELFVLRLATILKINLKGLANKGLGVGLSNNFAESGEKFLINKVLPNVLDKVKKEMVMFDVGANAGDYSEILSRCFLKAQIHAFEPNPNTFKNLEKKFKERKNVHTNNFGFGAIREKTNIYYYDTDKTTGHASINRKVFELHKRTDIDFSQINIETIDEYSKTQNIHYIDFMKIDTEGFEYNVLLGAKEMLKAGRIGFIQFEFNEMNISNRIFLKDFFDLLPDYEFYRLKKNSLFPLKEYSSKDEVFIIQNLFAVNKQFAGAIKNLKVIK